MKQKFVMTALIAGFLGSVGTVFAADNVQPAPLCVQPGIARQADGRGYGRMPDARQARQNMKQSLNLSDSQEAKMMELRRGYFQESRPLRDSIRNLKHDLALESVKKSADNRKITSLTRRIGEESVRLAQLESRHLRELATVLDAGQIDRLLQMKDHFGGRRMNRG